RRWACPWSGSPRAWRTPPRKSRQQWLSKPAAPGRESHPDQSGRAVWPAPTHRRRPGQLVPAPFFLTPAPAPLMIRLWRPGHLALGARGRSERGPEDAHTMDTEEGIPSTQGTAAREALERFVVENDDLLTLESRIGRFNIFDALGITRVEIRHSNFLAF